MPPTFKRGFLLSKPDSISKSTPKPPSRSAKETRSSQATGTMDDTSRKQTELSLPDSDKVSSLRAAAMASLASLSEAILSCPSLSGFTMRICLNVPTETESASAFCVWAMRSDLQAEFPIHQHFKPCSKNKSYRIGDSAISGSGMFALRDFSQGESIMMEQPVLLMPSNNEGLDVRLELLLAEAAAATIRTTLSPTRVAQFDSLTICESKRCLGPVVGKVSTNGIPCRFPQSEDDPMYMGLFLDISRCNHSCVPNATWGFDSRTLTMDLRVYRHIKKGEEITVAYTLSYSPHSERQEFLSRSFSFVCACPACTLPPQEISKRDAAIESIYAAYETFDRIWNMVQRNPQRLLRRFVVDVERIEELIERYTVMEEYHNDFDHFLAKAYAMLGEKEKSREWAQNAKKADRLEVVKGFGFVEKHKEDWDAWICDPTSSPYWRKM